jgi:hypothetical protein
MLLEKIIKSQEGRILLSIIWGLGLATLFRKVCKDRTCIIYKAPNPNNIVDKVYKYNEKCFKYNIETTGCTENAINH